MTQISDLKGSLLRERERAVLYNPAAVHNTWWNHARGTCRSCTGRRRRRRMKKRRRRRMMMKKRRRR